MEQDNMTPEQIDIICRSLDRANLALLNWLTVVGALFALALIIMLFLDIE